MLVIHIHTEVHVIYVPSPCLVSAAYMCLCTHLCLSVCLSVCLYLYICWWSIYIQKYMWYMYLHSAAYMSAYMQICLYVGLYVCMYIYIYIYVCIYMLVIHTPHTEVHVMYEPSFCLTYVCIYTSMYVCLYVKKPHTHRGDRCARALRPKYSSAFLGPTSLPHT